MRAHLLVLFTVGINAPAHGEPMATADPVPQPPGLVDVHDTSQPEDRSALDDRATHLEFGAGADLAHLTVGNMLGDFGMHFNFGPQVGRLSLLIESDLFHTQAADGTTGIYVRAAFAPRLALWRRAGGPLFGGPSKELSRYEVWIEPSVGIETASQELMPTLSRSDASLAIGLERSWHYAEHLFGVYYAVRGMAAELTPGEQKRDYSVVLTWGLLFGR